jgi:hypothetical protein
LARAVSNRRLSSSNCLSLERSSRVSTRTTFPIIDF